MTAPFLVTKSPKSVGIALLLTFLFGPIGLLYASVSGGLILTFIPIFLLLLLLVGAWQDNSAGWQVNPAFIDWSVELLMILGLLYWLIIFIWAVISLRSYNEEIEYDAKRRLDLWNMHHEKDQNQFVINSNQKSLDINTEQEAYCQLNQIPGLVKK